MRAAAKLLALTGVVGVLAASAAVLWPDAGGADRAVASPVGDFCVVAPATPFDPASGLPMLAPKPVPADARCPVCGMYPARFPHWAAQVVFSDGASQYFDSPLDLLVFLARVERYNPRYVLGDVVARFVTDADSGKWITLEQAYFVHGSSALGPMRDGDLPAFSTRAQAARFTDANGGRVLKVAEITPDEVRALSGNLRHRH